MRKGEAGKRRNCEQKPKIVNVFLNFCDKK